MVCSEYDCPCQISEIWKKVSGQREIAFTVSGKVANNMGDEAPNHTKIAKKEMIEPSARSSAYDFRWGGNGWGGCEKASAIDTWVKEQKGSSSSASAASTTASSKEEKRDVTIKSALEAIEVCKPLIHAGEISVQSMKDCTPEAVAEKKELIQPFSTEKMTLFWTSGCVDLEDHERIKDLVADVADTYCSLTCLEMLAEYVHKTCFVEDPDDFDSDPKAVLTLVATLGASGIVVAVSVLIEMGLVRSIQMRLSVQAYDVVVSTLLDPEGAVVSDVFCIRALEYEARLSCQTSVIIQLYTGCLERADATDEFKGLTIAFANKSKGYILEKGLEKIITEDFTVLGDPDNFADERLIRTTETLRDPMHIFFSALTKVKQRAKTT